MARTPIIVSWNCNGLLGDPPHAADIFHYPQLLRLPNRPTTPSLIPPPGRWNSHPRPPPGPSPTCPTPRMVHGDDYDRGLLRRTRDVAFLRIHPAGGNIRSSINFSELSSSCGRRLLRQTHTLGLCYQQLRRPTIHRADILDFALHCNLPAPLDVSVVQDLSSDQLPITININDYFD
ncbi:hypothetical protein J6590_103346 [Homalodisca vitripennis]|nr:hypothetical protein J6590_103346 [Homalodisca vitripennis]